MRREKTITLANKVLILVLWILAYQPFVGAQKSSIRFERISFEEGLSQNSINCILQDNEGFIWFGTYDGLNKYDGYNITVFRNRKNDTTSIADDYINVLYEDHSGNLWIGTRSKGLSKFNKFTNTFSTISESSKHIAISSNTINDIIADENNNLWIGTANGLNKISNNKCTRFFRKKEKHDDINPNTINAIANGKNGILWIASLHGIVGFDPIKNQFIENIYSRDIDSVFTMSEITDILEDSKGILWAGTDNGLFQLIRNKDNKIVKAIAFRPGGNHLNNISDNRINTIFEDNSGILWIGTERGGLNKFNRRTQQFTHYKNVPSDNYSLSSNNVSVIYQDRFNILWIGTSLGGINKWDKTTENIHLYHHDPENKNSLSSNKVRCIYQDNAGNIWIGTVDGGLNKWNTFTNRFTHFRHDPDDANSLANNHIRSVIQDSDGKIWIGTDGGGLDEYDPFTDRFTHHKFKANDPYSLSNNRVWKVFKDSKDNIWVGTFGGGLCRLLTDKNGNVYFMRYIHDIKVPGSISDNKVTTIFEDHTGTFWVGTFGGGLNRWNKKKSFFTYYQYIPENSNSISDDRVYSIIEDSENTLWIGTKSGLNRYNRKNDGFIRYTEENGLPNNVIMGILEDNSGHLWISTNNGISKFDKTQKTFQNYDKNKGLQGSEFLVGAFHKANDGRFFFGGINGFNVFYPDSVKNNSIPPKMVITDFKIFNQTVQSGPGSPLKNHITKAKIIFLDYSHNVFAFEFAALHYSQPERNQYAYKMENFDKDWIYTTANRRFATYTNLNPGEYIFRVKGANSDGIWNKESKAIRVVITPPFWKTWWFRALMLLFVLGVIYGWNKYRISRIKKQKEKLEEQVVERTAEIEQQKEEILAQAEQLEKLSIVASETDNAVVIMNNDGIIDWVNDGYARMYEYSYEELINQLGTNILNSYSSSQMTNAINKCLDDKITVNYELFTKTKSGKEIWVQTTLTPILDFDDNVTRLIAISSDITQIKEAEREIMRQKDELESKNKKIEQQNEHIKGSIRYALTIQKAILPIKENMDKFFDSFIIYRPKDIVSGDLYWFSCIQDERVNNKELIFIAVADCTGHGVPGAFMSMIASRLLSETINEEGIFSPDQILEELDKRLKIALKQDQTDNNDGFDIALCRIEKNETTDETPQFQITFSAAKRPLFYYSMKNKKLEIIKGDHRLIGGIRQQRKKPPFTNKELLLQKEDMLYLTSDGIIDQNNPDRKRFGTKRLTGILSKNAMLEMEQQGKILELLLDNYQQDEDQRDDITVLGVKLK